MVSKFEYRFTNCFITDFELKRIPKHIRCGRIEARNYQSNRAGNTGHQCAYPERTLRKDYQQYVGVQESWSVSDGAHYLWQV